jgi:hypothetical protein
LRTSAPSGFHVVQGLGVRSEDRTLSNVPAALVVLAAEIVSRSSRTDDRFRKPGLYAQVGIACYLRVEVDPPHVVAYLLGPDGVYEEVGRAAPGEVLKLTEPFPISIDPAALVR